MLEGSVTAGSGSSGTISIPGNLIVGSLAGGLAASVTTSGGTPFNAGKTFTVYTNGSLGFGSAAQYLSASLYLIGGSFSGSQPYFQSGSAVYMTGGNLGGTIYGSGSFGITSYSNATPAVVSASLQANNHTFTVNRGSGPVDLNFSGTMNGNYTLTKAGGGVLVSSGANSHTNTLVTAGTFCFNGSSSRTAVTVSPGATLAGYGTIGGGATYTNANVALAAGTSTNSMATLAPGGIDGATGAHLLGTLNVGSVDQTNNVTFNNFTRLSVNLGATPANCDCLAVNGLINLGALASNPNYLDIATTNASLKSGNYTVASFLSLTGRFTTVRATLPGRYTVNYLGTPSGTYLLNGSIVVSVAGQGTALFFQ